MESLPQSLGDEGRRRRLLLFVNEASYIFSHRLPVLREAVAAGFDVHVACQDLAEYVIRLRAEGVTAHDVPVARGLSGPIALLRGLRAFDRTLRAVRPDVVHCITIKQVLLGGPIAALRRVSRRVYSINGFGSAFTGSGALARVLRLAFRPLLRSILRSPHAWTIVQNEDDRQFLDTGGYCRPGHLALTHGSGVDTDAFHPGSPPAGPLRIVFGARMIREKGVVVLAEASRLLRGRGIEAEVVLAGPLDPFNPSGVAESTIRGWEREGLVKWLGSVEDMPSLLRQSHIACLPSWYREGLPKFLAEAAASGLPAVTCDVVGCRAAVRDGATGILVPPHDAAAVADALARLIEDGDLRRSMGDAARAFAVTQFDQARIASEIVALYGSARGPER